MLGMAGMVEYALHLAVPIVLVRALTPDDFGDYRLVWLLANTAIAIFPLAVPQSLFRFLPQATDEERPKLVGNTLLFLVLAGFLAGALLWTMWSWFPPTIAGLQKYSALVPVFLALWVAGRLIEVLPVADGNARWQAACLTLLGVGRTIALALAAILSQDATYVIATVTVFALTRILLVPAYAYTSASTRGLGLQTSLLLTQVRYSFPFALGNGLFLLRMQADQWIVATFFEPSVFALVSIAAVVLSASRLIRQPLNNALLPKLSTLVGEGRLEDAAALQARAFSALSLILLPALGLFFVLAHEIVEIVYTSTYLPAAPLMQIYLVGQMTGAFATGHLLVILNAGRVATNIAAASLVISVIVSLVGVQMIGLEGAVAGSVISVIIAELMSLHAVKRRLKTRLSSLFDFVTTGQAVLVVTAGILAALAVRQQMFLTFDVWSRLLGTGIVYGAILVLGGIATGLHVRVFGLTRGLFAQRAA